ncbi:hypothetical protein DB032_19450 [Chromobacterium sp. Panama]|nr:hypothetical protein DB032_19450 [Chromobacterium sp. Panama]
MLSPVLSRDDGATSYRLKLSPLPSGREFAWAELRLPKDFPTHAQAKIYLSPDAILRIPHVEWAGALCIDGDPGPGCGLSAEERIFHLLLNYHDAFLRSWTTGALDEDFALETLNYWAIEVAKARAKNDPVRAVWTVAPCPEHPVLLRGTLLTPERIVIASDEQLPITNRLIRVLGAGASQRLGVLVADIPISHALTPQTWPRTASELDVLLYARLEPRDYDQLRDAISRRGRRVHRIVLLRNNEFAYAYLLPSGPATVVDDGWCTKTYPSRLTPQPLNTERLDPAWTVGRDQHPEVNARQGVHVLVLGVGALGSPVIDHLAKAGIGLITAVDTEDLEPPNIGRHLLGAESIGKSKAVALAQRINTGYPATIVTPITNKAEAWLNQHSLGGVDAVLDLTGEPDVRRRIDQARRQHPCPLLIGWMEPYVAAAHVCTLPADTPWLQGNDDHLTKLEAVVWPKEVIRREPGCSSRFQSYTAAAAAHAVALVAEQALDLIDGGDSTAEAQVVSWVRGQRYLDKHWPGLELKAWAQNATPHDGIILRRAFP